MTGRILVGVDGSKGSRRALAWALEEAAARRAVLEAVVVWKNPYDIPRDFDVSYPVDEAKLAEHARTRLAASIAEAGGEHTTAQVEQIVLEGDPAETLCRRAMHTDLLVVGSRGHGTFAGLLLGSVSSKCAHHSPRPVVIVPPSHGSNDALPSRATDRIVVGVDGSAGSLRALRWAVDEGGVRGATVQPLLVWRGVETDDDMAVELATFPSLARHDRVTAEHARELLQQVVSEILGESSTGVEPIVLEGDPADILCRHARDADLLVVGSRGHGTFAELLLGSVSAKCAHHSPCSVVIVPSERDVHAATSRTRS